MCSSNYPALEVPSSNELSTLSIGHDGYGRNRSLPRDCGLSSKGGCAGGSGDIGVDVVGWLSFLNGWRHVESRVYFNGSVSIVRLLVVTVAQHI